MMEAQQLFPLPPIGPDACNSEKSLLSPVPSTCEKRLVGAALNNLGNTCFVNAVLQCITHTVPLVEKLQSTDHPSCSGVDGRFCAFCALRDHVEQCLVMSGKVVSPTCFASNLSEISSDFEIGKQEDAHEFLRCLLDSLHANCLQPSVKIQLCSVEEDNCIVKQVFGGRLRSRLQCSDCGHCSDTFEPMLDLSLGIDEANSIKEALDSFAGVEKFDQETKFFCGGCQQQVSMEKELKLDKAPAVVALHLKRFKTNGFFTEKIEKIVKYDLELDLKPFLSTTDVEDELKYDLYAVVVHLGSGQYWGHYYSFIRSFPSTWHLMDDSEAIRVTEADALTQPAYLLFYIKQGTSPFFSSFMELQKMAHPGRFCDSSPTSVLDPVDREPSAEEPSCSNARGSQENNELSNPSADAFTEPLLVQCKRNPVPIQPITSCPVSNINRTERDPTLLSMTQLSNRPFKDEHSIDILFDDEPSDYEQEKSLILVAPMGSSKGLRGEGKRKPVIEAAREVHMDNPSRRLARGMPLSRRTSFLMCLRKPHQSQSRRSSMEKRQPLNKKRRKICFASVSGLS